MTIRAHKWKEDAVLLLVLVPVGFGTKFYDGPSAWWVHNYAGALVYEVFWILFFGLFLPAQKSSVLALAVFVVTCVLECMQLWHPPLLNWVRSFFLGRALIGNGFDWWDFPYYALGCLAGWGVRERHAFFGKGG